MDPDKFKFFQLIRDKVYNWITNMEQPSKGLLPIFTLHSKPWEFRISKLKEGNIHTNILGNYYTYLIHLHTFHSDVLKVNSQQVYT